MSTLPTWWGFWRNRTKICYFQKSYLWCINILFIFFSCVFQNANILNAVLMLIKDLDHDSLEVVANACKDKLESLWSSPITELLSCHMTTNLTNHVRPCVKWLWNQPINSWENSKDVSCDDEASQSEIDCVYTNCLVVELMKKLTKKDKKIWKKRDSYKRDDDDDNFNCVKPDGIFIIIISIIINIFCTKVFFYTHRLRTDMRKLCVLVVISILSRLVYGTAN